LAKALEDVDVQYVWRFLREAGLWITRAVAFELPKSKSQFRASEAAPPIFTPTHWHFPTRGALIYSDQPKCMIGLFPAEHCRAVFQQAKHGKGPAAIGAS
jgi:hypothetical protein